MTGAVGTGWMVRKALLRRDLSAFVMELPPYHLPTLRGLLIHTWHRLKGFVLSQLVNRLVLLTKAIMLSQLDMALVQTHRTPTVS